MSFTRSLVALTVGFGFSLSACTGEPDSGTDLDTDVPEMKPMGNGSGWNGGDPAVVGPCLKGIIRASHEQPGQDPNDPTAYNPALDDYRCNGQLVSDLNSDPTSLPITHSSIRDEILEVMAWAGAHRGDDIDGFEGNSFMANNWATDAVPTAGGQTHHFASLVLAKFNHNSVPVPIGMKGPALSHSSQTDDLSDYSIEESMITVIVNPGMPEIRMLQVFASDKIEEACGSSYWDYFNARYCHLPLINPNVMNCYDTVQVRHESDIPYYCKKQDGTTAYNIEEAHTCDQADVLKIYVRPGDLPSLDYCDPLGIGH